MDTTEFDLVTAVRAGDHQTLERILGKHRALVDEPNADGDTLLHLACLEKQLGLIGILVRFGANVNKRGNGGRTPLHYAVQDGRAITLPLIGLLIDDHGADATIRDDQGRTPAQWARLQMKDKLPETLEFLENRPSAESRQANSLRDFTREALAIPANDSIGKSRMLKVLRALTAELRTAWKRDPRRD